MTQTEPAVADGPALRRATRTIQRLRARLAAATGPVAVIGAGLRFPGGIGDLDGYWSALRGGRDLVTRMPAHRQWPFAAQWSRLPTRGSFLPDALDFDPAFFGISPRAARAVDPQHRLLLEVTWEAIAHAGIAHDALRERPVGVYTGLTGRQDYADWAGSHVDAYWATGNGHSFAPGRIAYTFGFTGPAVAVDSACSSSLVAIHHAVGALRRGEIELALAGGVNLVLAPGSTRAVDQTGSLAPDGLCKTFDARANGYVRGEGAAMVVLKRLVDAERDGDPVLGIVHGTAVNQDGRSSGFTAPNAEAQRRLIAAALADAGATPADIGLVEAHGTGTALGDPIEMSAIAAALGSGNGGRALHVGSVKTNLGHLEAASGVAGLLKALLCVRERVVPPLVHFRTLNPRIDLSGTDIRVAGTAASWSVDDAGPLAGVSSFGLVGTNAHAVIGPPPRPAPIRPAVRPPWQRTRCVPGFLGEPPDAAGE
ncbi:polyketide synthase [Nocardia farcinica]|uniref:beta-ketoacyl [acyl carrier protein] synthase domain-containing protein n=1 Tax=Nocardia farcinica TaxID=37329 RepID=UPI002458B679|nr:polyketide synthase [Nocardia farcinica]